MDKNAVTSQKLPQKPIDVSRAETVQMPITPQTIPITVQEKQDTDLTNAKTSLLPGIGQEKQDTDLTNAKTSLLPTIPPPEPGWGKQTEDLANMMTAQLPVPHEALMDRSALSQRSNTGMARVTLQTPPLMDTDTRRNLAVSRYTLGGTTDQLPPSEEIAPEVARLIEHREEVARQETRQLRALTAIPAPVPQPQPGVVQEQPKAEPEQQEAQPKGFLRKKRRVPVLQQITMAECGAACLAMILSYYGRRTTISEVRERCGVGRDGLSALSIVKSARLYGMRVRAVTLQDDDEDDGSEDNGFGDVPLPAIVHWEFNHFMVVERWTAKHVEVVDPAAGRRRLSAREFDDGFTGVVITMEPGTQFSRANKRSGLTIGTYAKSYFSQAPASLAQVLITSFLLQLLGLIFPLLSAIAVNQLIPMKMEDALLLFGVGMIMLIVTQLITRLLRSWILFYLESRVDIHLLFSFLEHLLSLPQRFFLQRSTGDIISRIGSNAVIRDTVSNQLFSTLLDGTFVLLYFGILITQSLLFTGVVLVIGILQSALLLSTTKTIQELNRRELVATGKTQGYLTEILVGIKTLKSAGAEQRALERWSNLFFSQFNISMRRAYIGSLIDTAMSALGSAAPLILLWIGVLEVIHGTMPLGTMLALNSLGSSILGPFLSLVMSVRQVQIVQSHMERLADVIDAEPEQDIEKVTLAPKLTGRISLQDVSFQYDAQSPPVLRDVDLDILSGQKVAIVGRTGSGKSTLGNLLLGIYVPTKGEIFYDQIALRTLNYQSVRSQFGIVMQEADIFSGSVRENITLNNPGLGMEQVIWAAQMAAIHDDVMKMPMEYETLVSEGGNALSGGQRQRLAIARAVVSSPAILLLDEATSSLDVVTEKAVEQHLNGLSCTQIVIAHRLSTVRNADLILVLHEGRIVERGTHQQLLHAGGYYANLIQSQLANGELVEK